MRIRSALSLQQVAEPFALLAYQIIKGDRQVADEYLRCVMVEHGADRLDGDAVSHRRAQID